MKIAYVTTYDASDVANWSGTGYYIAQSLREQSIVVEPVGPLRDTYKLWSLAKKLAYRCLTGQRYLADRDLRVIKDYARQATRKISRLNVDVVFSPGTLPIAFIECQQPIVIWADGTFGGMINFYPGLTNLHQIRSPVAISSSKRPWIEPA